MIRSKEEIEEALAILDKFIFSRDKAVQFLSERKNETIGQWITAFMSLVNYSLCFNDWGKLEIIREVLQSTLDDQLNAAAPEPQEERK